MSEAIETATETTPKPTPAQLINAAYQNITRKLASDIQGIFDTTDAEIKRQLAALTKALE